MKKQFNKKAFIINLLRRGTYRYPPRNEALKKARVSRGCYQCKECGPSKTHDRHSIAVDHRIPVVDPEKGFTDWNDYINRMFCEEEYFDILCHEHHDKKTDGENKVRKKTRSERLKLRRDDKKAKKAKDPKTNKHTGQALDDFLKECGIDLPAKNKPK